MAAICTGSPQTDQVANGPILGRWIHDHLPHAGPYFFPKYWAFNISWHEKPTPTIFSYAEPKGRFVS